MTEESALKKQIMGYLEVLPGAFFKIIQVKGIRGRTSPTKGVLDIIGSYYGRAVAIEVKVGANQLELSQRAFVAGWTTRGQGHAIVARSLDDVTSGLQKIFQEVMESV